MENIKFKIGVIYFDYKLQLINTSIDKLSAKANILNQNYLQNQLNADVQQKIKGNINVISSVDKIFAELEQLVNKKLSYINIIIFCKKHFQDEINSSFDAKDIAHYVFQKNLHSLLMTMEEFERYEECETILSELQLFKQIAA